jgi:RHS repeat-associated protein
VVGAIVIVLLAGSLFASGLVGGRSASRASAAVRRTSASASLARLRRQAALREAEHRRWLDSAAAVSQRVASRMAFHGLSAHAASGLLLRDFGSALSSADSPPSVSIVTKAPVVRYLGAYKALVRGPQGPQVVNSMLPLAHMVDGRERPIDLQLKSSAAGFLPVNAPGDVSIARDLAGGVSLGSAGVAISMEGRDVEGTPLGGSSAFFPGVAQDVDATVTPTDSGVELFATLRSRLSPEGLRYRLALPSGAVLRAAGGGAQVVRGGHLLASIPSPTATDAQGQNVAVATTVVGDQLVLRIAHRAQDYTYPILVDPEVNKEEGAPGWTFQQGEYSEGFKVLPEGPFLPKNPGSMEILKGADTEGEAPREARWLWKGPSGLKVMKVALSYTTYSEPEKLAYQFQALVISGCSDVEPYPVEGKYNFSPYEDGTCPATNEIEITWQAPGYKSLTATAHLYLHAIWITESPTTRAASEDYGSGNQGEPGIPRVSCGGSVNCATGNEFDSHTDLSLGGNPGLNLTRTYNSQLAAAQTSPSQFGYGWSSFYGAYLSFTAARSGCSGEILCSVKAVTVHQENGSTVSFEESAVGWLAGPLTQATLKEQSPSQTYEYTLPDGAVFTFNKEGRLTSESDPNGNLTTLTYNEKNQLTKAEEGAGRSIMFAPNSEGLITEAKDLLGAVKYTYASGNLTEVTDTDKHVWKYGYGTSHQMTSQTDPLSHATTREYDSSHRVISEEDPLKRKRTWKYVTSESGTETTVTNPNGSISVERYDKANLPTSITNAYGTALAATTTYEYGPALNLIAVTDANKHTTKYTYDWEDNRTTETNADEDTTEWGYSFSGHELQSIKMPSGEETRISRDGHKRPVEIKREAPGSETQITKYKYDAKGDLESIEDPLKRVWKYEYDAYGDRTAETDPEGNKRTWIYDEGSQEMLTTSPRGNAVMGEAARFTTKTERDAEGRVLSQTEPLSEALDGSEFGSAGSGEGQLDVPVGLATDSGGNVWVADTDNNRIEKFSSSGTYLAAYTSIGTGSTALKEPKGVTIDSKGDVWVSDTGNHRIVELNSSGALVLAFGYGVANGKSEPETCTSKCGAGIEGSGNGQIQGAQNAAIDSKGNVWVAETGNNRIQEFNEKGEYVNKFGSEGTGANQFKTPNDITISAGNIYVADFTNNRIDELSATGAFVQAFGYGVANGESKPETCTSTCQAGISGSGNGQFNGPARISTEPATGNIFVADHANARIEVLNQAGAFLASFGSAGKGEGQLENLKGVTVSSNGSVYVAEAGSEHIQHWTTPTPRITKYAYDAAGNLETLTDPNGNKTKYTYDADNELTKTEAPNKTLTETEYDSAGQVTSQTDGNKHTTKYTRNILEEVTEVADPLSHKTAKEYDLAGDLTSVTNPAKQTTTYTYDPANWLTEVKYSDGKTPTVKYEYNTDGDRTTMTDGTGTSKYTYDQLDRLTEAENGHKEKIKYEYDLANEQTKITYPNGKAITRAYDKDGRLEKITDWLSNTTKFTYDPNSDIAATVFPSASSDEDKYAYNEADAMSEVKMLKGTETLASQLYTRDSDEQVKTTVSKGLPGEEKTADEYDTNSRLTKGATSAYEYDAANNPAKIAAGTYKYNAADELETGPSLTYTYNENNQRTKTTPTSGPTTTYSYDQAGNLITAERPKEGETPKIEDTYAYNGEGLRSSQTISGTTSYLAWDTAEELPLILNDGSNSYIYGPNSLPFEQINNTTAAVTYIHHDQAGSTRLLTGSTGKVEGSYSYSAYGTPEHTGTATTPLGYDEQYTSSDTGLVYLRNRVYDPSTAQFLSIDPLEMVTRAPYNYAEDNPANHSDPTGLGEWEPWTESFWTEGNFISNSPLNPIPYYEKEIESYENGCGYFSSVTHGLEGTLAGAALFAGGEGADEADVTVSDVLAGKVGKITRAPLPPGSPAWADIQDMSIADVRAAAKANEPGFKMIYKLLNDNRFNKP